MTPDAKAAMQNSRNAENQGTMTPPKDCSLPKTWPSVIYPVKNSQWLFKEAQ